MKGSNPQSRSAKARPKKARISVASGINLMARTTDAAIPTATPQPSSTSWSFSWSTGATLAASRSLIRCHRFSLPSLDAPVPGRLAGVDFLLALRLGGRLGCALFCDGGGGAVPAFNDRFRLSEGVTKVFVTCSKIG